MVVVFLTYLSLGVTILQRYKPYLPPRVAVRSRDQLGVATLCHQQPGLTSLDLSGCSELADGAVLAVSRGLRHLRRLSLDRKSVV